MKATATASAANINGEIYVSDGDYIKDIEINDLRNRYVVTNAANQKKVDTFGVLAVLPLTSSSDTARVLGWLYLSTTLSV